MFVFNIKLDGNKTAKIFIGILCVILLLITFFVCYKLIFNSFFKTNDDVNLGDTVYDINSQNYTNVLQNVHNHLNDYIGQKVKFSGFVYRLYDFTDSQFVLARNMIISSDYKSVVVGFLCSSSEIKNYKDNEWVEIEGTITKGDYHGEIPIIKITKINKADAPSEEYVYPPDNSFVTTSTVL